MILHRYTMTNKHHTAVQVITFGARVVSVSVADNHGKVANVVLGCADIAGLTSAFLNFVDICVRLLCYTVSKK